MAAIGDSMSHRTEKFYGFGPTQIIRVETTTSPASFRLSVQGFIAEPFVSQQERQMQSAMRSRMPEKEMVFDEKDLRALRDLISEALEGS